MIYQPAQKYFSADPSPQWYQYREPLSRDGILRTGMRTVWVLMTYTRGTLYTVGIQSMFTV